MDMETVAGDGIFRNMEVGIDQYGLGNISCVPVPIVSQLERFASGIFHSMGSIVECDDIYFNLLSQSELWVMEEML